VNRQSWWPQLPALARVGVGQGRQREGRIRRLAPFGAGGERPANRADRQQEHLGNGVGEVCRRDLVLVWERRSSRSVLLTRCCSVFAACAPPSKSWTALGPPRCPPRTPAMGRPGRRNGLQQPGGNPGGIGPPRGGRNQVLDHKGAESGPAAQIATRIGRAPPASATAFVAALPSAWLAMAHHKAASTPKPLWDRLSGAEFPPRGDHRLAIPRAPACANQGWCTPPAFSGAGAHRHLRCSSRRSVGQVRPA